MDNTIIHSYASTFVETPPNKSRKRERRPETWKRNLEKVARQKPKTLPKKPKCKHPENSQYKCRELSIADVRKIYIAYYSSASLNSKKNFILQHVQVSNTKRHRTESDDNFRKRQVSTTYYLPQERGAAKENLKVCRNAFLTVLQESRSRLQNICKKYLDLGFTPPERRGGRRDKYLRIYDKRKTAIKEFVKTFKPLQQHYIRGKNVIRRYLSSDINITKMWKMYMAATTEENLKVDYEYFRVTVNESFNIGFDAPYTEKCSICTRLDVEIINEKDKTVKEKLEMELKLHKLRAERFNELLQTTNENELILSYDCQKNLVLPKVPDQTAYFYHQLYLYNFTICVEASGSNLDTSTTFAYLWTEDEFAKGSNQIASAVHHQLLQCNFDKITSIKLFSDSCGCQNKNKTIIAMLSYFLLFEASPNIEKVTLYFPIVGHALIPPDRVFDTLERKFNCLSEINNPDQYIKIIKEHSTVKRLGQNCSVHDWKAYGDKNLKQPGNWHFQFQKSKKIVITRSKYGETIIVQGEPFYEFECGKPKSLVKRGKSLTNAVIAEIPRGVTIKSAKLNDVFNLLVLHYGENWQENPNLKYYSNVLVQNMLQPDEQNKYLGEEIQLDFEINDESSDIVV